MDGLSHSSPASASLLPLSTQELLPTAEGLCPRSWTPRGGGWTNTPGSCFPALKAWRMFCTPTSSEGVHSSDLPIEALFLGFSPFLFPEVTS